jgi:hypothetical protein
MSISIENLYNSAFCWDIWEIGDNGADNISSRVKQVILPLWLIAGDSMKQTLTDLAKKSFTAANKLKEQVTKNLNFVRFKQNARKV